MGSTATANGQVFADSCLVCSQQCFIRSHVTQHEESKLTASRRKRSPQGPTPVEIRLAIYKAFDVTADPEEVSSASRQVKGSTTFDLPLCAPCLFKVGQLRALQTQLSLLERQYDKMREEIAFSIVDVVASSLTSSVCTNIADQPPNVILRKLREHEVGTLQQLVFEKWHEASYTDFDDSEEGGESCIEPPSSSHHNSLANGKGKSSQPRPDPTRKLSSSSSSVTVTSSGAERQSSISITKVESGGSAFAFENQQLQILDVEEESQFTTDMYMEEEPESPPIPEELLLEDDEFDPENDLDDNDLLTFPFGLELAEYSSSMQKEEDFDEEEDNEQKKQAEANQNLEIFRDADGLYECQFCQKKFIHKYPFRDHLRVHFGDGPRCKICHKIFPKKHNLMLHLRTHSGEKPYVCTVCDKGFADKSNLKVHMRVHTGERPYKCEYCNVAFSNSSRLVVHKRTHTGEKPFTCDICNRKCTTRNQLSTHRKTHFQAGRSRLVKKDAGAQLH